MQDTALFTCGGIAGKGHSNLCYQNKGELGGFLVLKGSLYSTIVYTG